MESHVTYFFSHDSISTLHQRAEIMQYYAFIFLISVTFCFLIYNTNIMQQEMQESREP